MLLSLRRQSSAGSVAGWATVVGLTMALATACSAPVIERLDGEPESAQPFTTEPAAVIPPAVDGLQRFTKAIAEGRAEAAWLQLSGETRAALRKRAATIGKSGVDLLRPMPAEGKGGPIEDAWIADPVALFALPGAVRSEPQEPPMAAHVPAEGHRIEQQVRLKDAAGKEKTVTMRFEGVAWCIHLPGLGG